MVLLQLCSAGTDRYLQTFEHMSLWLHHAIGHIK